MPITELEMSLPGKINMDESEGNMLDISVVVPVYNEVQNINPFLDRIEPILSEIGRYEILFCMDPSIDGTEECIKEQIKRNNRIGLICMSRRFGQPAAVIAGIKLCSGNTCVVIDVDLQDPPELILDLYQYMQMHTLDVVYAKRKSRKGETWIKRMVSYIGYKLINNTSDVNIPRNTGDFRIMSRRVVDELCKLKETNGFLRGLVAFVGFEQGYIEYDRDKRQKGSGKYNRLLGSLKIGFNGLVGFSNFLLSFVFGLGLLVFVMAVIGITYIFVAKFVFGATYALGVPTLIILVLLMGGVQLIAIGILGEYIGRIYDEVKQRPAFIIDKNRVILPQPNQYTIEKD